MTRRTGAGPAVLPLLPAPTATLARIGEVSGGQALAPVATAELVNFCSVTAACSARPRSRPQPCISKAGRAQAPPVTLVLQALDWIDQDGGPIRIAPGRNLSVTCARPATSRATQYMRAKSSLAVLVVLLDWTSASKCVRRRVTAAAARGAGSTDAWAPPAQPPTPARRAQSTSAP